MAQQTINVGTSANDGTGDPLRTCFQKSNSNFGELYSRFQTVIPVSSLGTNGDTAGMYAIDDADFYYCTGDYDGTTQIWYVVTGTTF